MANADFKRVNHAMMVKLLKEHGALDIPTLHRLMGYSDKYSMWAFEDDLKAGEIGFKAISQVVDVPGMFTVFPARERARYGFPDIVPVVKGENPDRKKREYRTVIVDGKATKVKRTADNSPEAQKQYWPVVALGNIEPPPSTGTETAYDGRYDDDIETLRQLLDDAGFEYLEIKGRMVRGGSGIYISMARDADSKSGDSGEIDVSGIVTSDHAPVAA